VKTTDPEVARLNDELERPLSLDLSRLAPGMVDGGAVLKAGDPGQENLLSALLLRMPLLFLVLLSVVVGLVLDAVPADLGRCQTMGAPLAIEGILNLDGGVDGQLTKH
jgi:hypothetical protein